MSVIYTATSCCGISTIKNASTTLKRRARKRKTVVQIPPGAEFTKTVMSSTAFSPENCTWNNCAGDGRICQENGDIARPADLGVRGRSKTVYDLFMDPNSHRIHSFQTPRCCIQSTQNEIDLMRSQLEIFPASSSQGKMFELDKQIKAAQRFMKRLEFQLCRAEELHEHYDTQARLKEGARNLAAAFERESNAKRRSKNSPASSLSVRGDMKNVLQSLNAIKMELELLLGVINIEMKGVVGFARIAPGDTFEVTVKHGQQKWKTKGKTQSNKKQKWDSEKTAMKVLLEQALEVKVSEVKLFGQTSGLAEQSCDPVQLFSPDPQLMTMNLTFNGSLKLNLVATWNEHIFKTKGKSCPSQSTDSMPSASHMSTNLTRSVTGSSDHRPVAPSPGKATTSTNSSCDRQIHRPPLLALLRVLKPAIQRLLTAHPELGALQNLINHWDGLLKRNLFNAMRSKGCDSWSKRGSLCIASAVENIRLNDTTSDSEELDSNILLRNASANTQDSGFDSFRRRYLSYSHMINGGDNFWQQDRSTNSSHQRPTKYTNIPSPRNTPPSRQLGQPFSNKNPKFSPRVVKKCDAVKSRRISLGSNLNRDYSSVNRVTLLVKSKLV